MAKAQNYATATQSGSTITDWNNFIHGVLSMTNTLHSFSVYLVSQAQAKNLYQYWAFKNHEAGFMPLTQQLSRKIKLVKIVSCAVSGLKLVTDSMTEKW